jgi:regulation of enolase protein 1 (concanavalin A-like superfamily)
MTTDDKLDYWRKTYYNPVILKDDGHFAGVTVPADKNYTIEVCHTK